MFCAETRLAGDPPLATDISYPWLVLVTGTWRSTFGVAVRSARQYTRRAERHLSGLIGTASHTDKQKVRIIGFFFETRVLWQFEVQLLLRIIYLHLNLSTTPDLKF